MRRRWVYEKGEAYEVPLDYVAEPRNTDAALWNDRAYQDDGDSRYGSRSQHREFMKRHGVTTADDFNSQWRSDEYRRNEFRSGVGGDRKRREAVERAIHTLEQKRR